MATLNNVYDTPIWFYLRIFSNRLGTIQVGFRFFVAILIYEPIYFWAATHISLDELNEVLNVA